jgi:cytochrome c oxidase subunit II
MQSKIMRCFWLLSICFITAALMACGRQPPRSSAPDKPSTTSGSELFEQLGCMHCHQMNGGGLGPSLTGLYGKTIPLENGQSVTADEQYIRTSIIDPNAQKHAGYQLVMPPFADRINEEELSALVEYIRSLEG